MEITDIKIRRIYQDNRLRALVSLTIDGELAVHDIKVIEGPERLFVAMPSRRDDNGVFRDIAHPITSEARRQMEDAILGAYHAYLETMRNDASTQQSPQNNLRDGSHFYSGVAPAPMQPSAEGYHRLPPQ